MLSLRVKWVVKSKTQLDVSGGVGSKVRFGVEGQYSRSVSEDGLKVGDSSHLALDVHPGSDQSIRISTTFCT